MDTKTIERYIESENIATFLSKEKLAEIGSLVVEEFDLDSMSRADLAEVNKKAMELAKQTPKKKSFPFENAASVKLPMITTAAIQFASRAFPALIPNEKIITVKVNGKDDDDNKFERGERVAKFMDYQITEEISNWLDDTDRMLHTLPIIGTCFRKIYYDSMLEKAQSLFLSFDDVVVNIKAQDIKTARRVTHIIKMFQNTVVEHQLAGLWLDVDLEDVLEDTEYEGDDAPHTILEQHRWLDLDGDGYQEPYIVTVHKDSRQVLRIVARYDAKSLRFKHGKIVRIEAIQYFVKYSFLPSLDGCFYDIGFGTLLYPINESANTVVNQLLDAGTISVAGGGFLGRGMRVKKGALRFKPGEWKTLDIMGNEIKNSIVPLPVKEPSQVLFQLLGLLISSSKEISSVSEAMSGQKPGENVSATTVGTLIDQGLKVFSGVYKRIYRAMTEEFRLLYRINSVYLKNPKYIKVLDDAVTIEDFNTEELDLTLSAEPQFSLEMHRIGRAENLIKLSGRKGVNEDKITLEFLKANNLPKDVLLPPDQRPPEPPDSSLIKAEADKFRSETERMKVETELQAAELEKQKLMAEIEKLRADANLQDAKAGSEAEAIKINSFNTFSDRLNNAKAKNNKL